MGPKKILVFPCGSEIGLEIHRSLRFAKEIELFGGSSVHDHGKFVYQNYFGDIPSSQHPRFIESINRYITEHNLDFVIPAHDSVLIKLAEASERGELACPVLTSPAETCRICRSKRSTYKFFEKILRTPTMYSDLGAVDQWPVFLKPDIGQGSRGTAIAKSFADARHHFAKTEDELIILELLPGDEFTVDCFTDMHGELRFIGPRQRVRVSNGISVNTTPTSSPALESMAETINQALRFRGMWFFQAKFAADDSLALLEIAPRVAGTMGLYRNLGVNFSLLSVYDASDIDVKVSCNNLNIEMDRSLHGRFRIDVKYSDVYIDLDDCLIIRNQVNTQAVQFIFQCQNRAIGVHLVTRHNGNLESTLRRFRLSDLFDSIHHLTDDRPKSAFIQDGPSIFIDDSHRERQEVHLTLGVPVFAPDAIESLLHQN